MNKTKQTWQERMHSIFLDSQFQADCEAAEIATAMLADQERRACCDAWIDMLMAEAKNAR